MLQKCSRYTVLKVTLYFTFKLSAVFNILAIEDGGFVGVFIFWSPNNYQIQDQTTIGGYLNKIKIQNILTTFQLLLALFKFQSFTEVERFSINSNRFLSQNNRISWHGSIPTDHVFFLLARLLSSPGAEKFALGIESNFHSDPEFIKMSTSEFLIRNASSNCLSKGDEKVLTASILKLREVAQL